MITGERGIAKRSRLTGIKGTERPTRGDLDLGGRIERQLIEELRDGLALVDPTTAADGAEPRRVLGECSGGAVHMSECGPPGRAHCRRAPVRRSGESST